MQIRYQTEPPKRQETSSLVTEHILREFTKNSDRVKFCYPHSVVTYRPDEPSMAPQHPYLPISGDRQQMQGARPVWGAEARQEVSLKEGGKA